MGKIEKITIFKAMNKILVISAAFFLLIGSTSLYADNREDSPSFTHFFQQQDNPDIQVKMYPNPLTGKTLTIKSNLNFKKIEVLNIVGNIMLDERYTEKTKQVTLDLESLDRGIYIVRLTYAINKDENKPDKHYLEKLIIQ